MVSKVQGTGKQYETLPVANGFNVKVDKNLYTGQKPVYNKGKAIYELTLKNGMKISLINGGSNSALTIEEGTDTFEGQSTNISGRGTQIVINAKNGKNDLLTVSPGVKFSAVIDRDKDDFVIGNGCVTTSDKTGY